MLWPNTQKLGPPPPRTDSASLAELHTKAWASLLEITEQLQKMVADTRWPKEDVVQMVDLQHSLFNGIVWLTLVLESRSDVEREEK